MKKPTLNKILSSIYEDGWDNGAREGVYKIGKNSYSTNKAKKHIKENYIKKDKLPSVAELAGILDAHRHCSISMQVRKILDRIKGEI